MTKKVLSLVFALILIMGAFAGCGGSSSGSSAAPASSGSATDAASSSAASSDTPAAADAVVFKVSHNFTNEQPLHIALVDVGNKIKERTNGAVILEIYSNAEIANGLDGVEQCIRGANFINVYDPSCMENWVPDYNALIGPMLYASADEYSKMAQSDFAKELNAKAEENGIKVLALDYTFGMRNIGTSKKVVEKLEDIKNMKLRVPKSQLWIETFTALGTNPVPLAWSELYNAVQQGVVDGFETSVSDMYDNQMHEVIKHVAMTNHFIGTAAVMTSKDVFDKLTPEQQAIIEGEFAAGAIANNEMSAKVEAEARSAMEASGVTFHEVDRAPFVEASKAFFEKYPGLTPGIYDKITAELEKIRA